MKMIRTFVTSCLIMTFAGCASSDVMSPGNALYPLTPGGDQYFAVDWQPGERKGSPVLTGTMTNRYGATAVRVQLLVEALDDNGNVTGQKVVWLGDDIAPFDRTSFEIPVVKSPKYRVRPFAFDWKGRAGP